MTENTGYVRKSLNKKIASTMAKAQQSLVIKTNHCDNDNCHLYVGKNTSTSPI